MPDKTVPVTHRQGKWRAGGLGDFATLENGAAGEIPIIGNNGPEFTSLSSQTTQNGIHGEIRFPEAKTYTIILDSEMARTIPELVTKTRVGTATATPKIGSTTLGGGASSVTTSKATVSHSSANAMAVHDTLNLVLSSVSSDCEDLSFSFKFSEAIQNA